MAVHYSPSKKKNPHKIRMHNLNKIYKVGGQQPRTKKGKDCWENKYREILTTLGC